MAQFRTIVTKKEGKQRGGGENRDLDSADVGEKTGSMSGWSSIGDGGNARWRYGAEGVGRKSIQARF
jgi:hypothetical protein